MARPVLISNGRGPDVRVWGRVGVGWGLCLWGLEGGGGGEGSEMMAWMVASSLPLRP